MKIRTILLSSLLLLNTPMVCAEASKDKDAALKKTNKFKNIGIGFLTSYTDFKFNSTTGDNFSRFSGHSTLYSASVGNILVAPSWTVGMSLFRVDTSLNSQIFINPGVPADAHQETHNDSLAGHVLKQFSPKYFIDIAGAYGQNRVNTQSTIMPGTRSSQIGSARNTNHSGFASVAGIYTRPWKNFSLIASARVLYSQVNAGSYAFTFNTANLPAQTVLPLTNKVWFLMENAEIDYKFDKTRFPFRPFVNAGLLQVLSFSNSRPVIGAVINGVSPQLSMNKDGYRVGGGLSLNHKNITVRVEEQYYSSAGTYSSLQTIAGIRYTIN